MVLINKTANHGLKSLSMLGGVKDNGESTQIIGDVVGLQRIKSISKTPQAFLGFV